MEEHSCRDFFRAPIHSERGPFHGTTADQVRPPSAHHTIVNLGCGAEYRATGSSTAEVRRVPWSCDWAVGSPTAIPVRGGPNRACGTGGDRIDPLLIGRGCGRAPHWIHDASGRRRVRSPDRVRATTQKKLEGSSPRGQILLCPSDNATLCGTHCSTDRGRFIAVHTRECPVPLQRVGGECCLLSRGRWVSRNEARSPMELIWSAASAPLLRTPPLSCALRSRPVLASATEALRRLLEDSTAVVLQPPVQAVARVCRRGTGRVLDGEVRLVAPWADAATSRLLWRAGRGPFRTRSACAVSVDARLDGLRSRGSPDNLGVYFCWRTEEARAGEIRGVADREKAVAWTCLPRVILTTVIVSPPR